MQRRGRKEIEGKENGNKILRERERERERLNH